MKIKKAQEKPIELHKKKELEIHQLKNEGFSLKYAGLQSLNSASKQIEGGEELRNAAMTEYMLAKPVLSASQKGASGIKKKLQQNKEKSKKESDKKDKRSRRDDERTRRDDSKNTKKSS